MPTMPKAGHLDTPAAVDAERVLLGALLLDNEVVLPVVEILPPGPSHWFYLEPHHYIYDAILTLSERREPIDMMTVTDVLNRRGHLEKIGGSLYLAELIETVTTTVNTVHHARLVREKALLRSLVNVGTEISAKAYEHSDIQEIIGQAHQALLQVANAQTTSTFTTMPTLMNEAIHYAEQAHEEHTTGITTGFYDLDFLTNGFQPSNLIIVAARPSMGKTSIALQFALHAAIIPGGQQVVLFSLEMSKDELGQRLLCSEARMDSSRIRRGLLSNPEWGHMVNAAERLRNARLLIDDTPSLTVMDIRTRTKRLQMESGLSMIVVDYLQLLRSHKRIESRVQEVSEISRDLKMLAKELNVPVIALSQLNREVEKRDRKIPQLSDLRDGGSIEQDADVVIFLYREGANRPAEATGDSHSPQPPAPEDNTATLILAKQRNGPTGLVNLAFHKEYARFDNLAHAHHHPVS